MSVIPELVRLILEKQDFRDRLQYTMCFRPHWPRQQDNIKEYVLVLILLELFVVLSNKLFAVTVTLWLV